MNTVGMLVDVSHSGDRTTLDAIDISAKPIAITHSNCRALIDHPRVKTDEAIKALAAKGGVRSEEHTSELQSLMRISYAVFCLKNNKEHYQNQVTNNPRSNTSVN